MPLIIKGKTSLYSKRIGLIIARLSTWVGMGSHSLVLCNLGRPLNSLSPLMAIEKNNGDRENFLYRHYHFLDHGEA